MPKPKPHFWLFLAAFYAMWILRATWFYSRVDLSIPDSTWRLVFSNGLKFALWVLPAAAYLLWHDRQNPLITMKVSTRIDGRGVLIGGGVSILYFASVIAFEYFAAHQTLDALLWAAPLTLLGTLAGLFFSPISEELFFRGFVLPKLNESMSFWPANLVQAALFVAIHWPNWLWVGGFHWSLVMTSVSIFILGLLFGWLTRRTNSVWPAVAMHVLNNFLAAFLG
jgi:uncharacterized protein